MAKGSSSKFKAAMIGGGAAGLLSIIPVCNIGNCFCCLWILLGGALAAMVVGKTEDRTLTPGEGALTGLGAGGVASAIYVFLGVPINLLLNKVYIELLYEADVIGYYDYQNMLDQGMGPVIVQTLIGVVVFVVLALGFSALGGLAGAAIFKKK